MSELAQKANVSKRTIDYYTTKGLLKAVRSPSNYRFYSEQALEDLKFIEQCKNEHMPLCEIKQRLDMVRSLEKDNEALKKQAEYLEGRMERLEHDICELLPFFQLLNDGEKRTINHKLSNRSSALMNSLASLRNI
ncbi:MerR family transcriptional regulator [Priestia filamentosa]|nr:MULTISPECIES: MerR family transcriptional regulator [Priestia]MED3727182.1 MerR family transcriptional regulator [Priestia filamentosa]UOE63179.1 MerR family transcriptional regulator [Priestia filamentosa]